jgi:hypothetical protein
MSVNLDKNVLNLEIDDNVGNGLAKINYNILNINQDSCELNQFFVDNDKFLTSTEELMDKLDVLIPKINYEFLQKLEATVQVLSGYWNKLEFTVQYPFNPVNGFVSSIVNAGEFGALISLPDEKLQLNMLADAMVKSELFTSQRDAIEGIKNKDIIFVLRDDNGNFTRWYYLDDSLIFNLALDRENNFYYNNRLVDLYKLPYFSVITPKNIDLELEGTFVDFDDKVIRQGSGVLDPNNTSITNNTYVNYSVLTRREISETDEPLDVTTLTPVIKPLNEIIANNNPVYKAKIAKINDDFLESVLQNPILNTVCLKFLNTSYAPQPYLDGTIINVCMFLYNTLGFDTADAIIHSDYFAPDNTIGKTTTSVVKIKKRKTPSNSEIAVVDSEALVKLDTEIEDVVEKTAPSSNTTFNVTFRKIDIYVERVVLVKYRKNSKLELITNKITGKVTPRIIHYWEFVNADIGPKYSINNESIRNVDNAPVYVKKVSTVSEILPFPTQITTKAGDFIVNKMGDTFLIDNVP